VRDESPARHAAYARHIAATEHRCYDERHGGVRTLVEWQTQHKDESAWIRAAGAHVLILSKPQLFIEGNHRSGALVMSYLLVREDKPPFVLTMENADADPRGHRRLGLLPRPGTNPCPLERAKDVVCE
jgi:hypothetical protein